MKIYPAIDLLDGKCVRLLKGDYDQRTIYEHDPVAVAKNFELLGASYLHIVDLEGSRGEELAQFSLIRKIVNETNLKVQVGGGIRSLSQAARYLELGVERVIIGSLAIKNIEATKEMFAELGPEKIVLSLDVKYDSEKKVHFIYIDGWQNNSGKNLDEIIEIYRPSGLRNLLCTDIDRDGMLSGISKNLYIHIALHHPDISFIVSGGVKDEHCLKDSKDLGADAAILGKAIYEKKVNLQEVFRVG